MIKKITALIIIVLFSLTQLVWAEASACFLLRPLAVEETDGSAGGWTRRAFLETMSILPAMGMLNGVVRASDDVLPARPAIEDGSRAVHVRTIRLREKQACANMGLTAYAQAGADMLELYRRDRRTDYQNSTLTVDAKEGLVLERAQERVIMALAFCAGAQHPAAQIGGWRDLMNALNGTFPEAFFPAAIAYWEARVALDTRRAAIAATAFPDNPRFASEKARMIQHFAHDLAISTSKLAQMRAMPRIVESMVMAGLPVPVFKVLLEALEYKPQMDTIDAVWELFPPVVNPVSAADPQKKSAALGRLREDLVLAYKAQIAIAHVQIDVRTRSLRATEALIAAGEKGKRTYVSRTEYETLKKETTSQNDADAAQIALLQVQIEAISQMTLDGSHFAPAISERMAASIETWELRVTQSLANLGSLRKLMEWMDAREREDPAKSWIVTAVRDLHMFELKKDKWSEELSAQVGAALGEIARREQEITAVYRAMGMSVSLPAIADADNGFIEFQRFVTPGVIPIEKPLSGHEVEVYSSRLKELQHACLEARSRLKETLARARNEDAVAYTAMINADEKIEMPHAEKRYRAEEAQYAADHAALMAKKGKVFAEEAARLELMIKTDEESERIRKLYVEQERENERMKYLIAREDIGDQFALAQIELLEAAAFRAEMAVIVADENTIAYGDARRAHERAVMDLRRARLDRLEKRVPQIEQRTKPVIIKYRAKVSGTSLHYVLDEKPPEIIPAARIHYEGILRELTAARARLRALISRDESLQAIGARIGPEKITPSGVSDITGVADVLSGKTVSAKFHDLQIRTSDGTMVGTFLAGEMRLGRVIYEDSQDNRFGAQTMQVPAPQGSGFVAASYLAKVYRDIGGTGERAIGTAFVEVGVPQLELQMASGRYSVIGLEGYRTISPVPRLLGVDPRSVNINSCRDELTAQGIDLDKLLPRLIKSGYTSNDGAVNPALKALDDYLFNYLGNAKFTFLENLLRRLRKPAYLALVTFFEVRPITRTLPDRDVTRYELVPTGVYIGRCASADNLSLDTLLLPKDRDGKRFIDDKDILPIGEGQSIDVETNTRTVRISSKEPAYPERADSHYEVNMEDRPNRRSGGSAPALRVRDPRKAPAEHNI